MRRVKRFVRTKKRETEAQIAKQGNGRPPDPLLVHVLEGRLDAYKVLAHYLDRLEEEDVLVNGTASAFSPQG